jgi:hypothetical protein
MRTDTHRQPQHTSVGRHPDLPARAAFGARTPARPTEEPFDLQANGFSSILRGIAAASAVTVLLGLVFVTAACFAAVHSPDPISLAAPLSAAALALASLLGGITAGRLCPARTAVAALLTGAAVALALSLLSLLPLHMGESGRTLPWLIRLGTVPVHLLGGILARPRRKAPTHTAGKHPSRR